MSANVYDNLTNKKAGLKIYSEGGVTSSLGMEPISLNYEQSADSEKAFSRGPFAQDNGVYNSYGITIGSGIGFSRYATYTQYLYQFSNPFISKYNEKKHLIVLFCFFVLLLNL